MLLKSYNKRIDTTSIKELITEGESNIDKVKIEINKDYNGIDLSGLTFVLRAITEKETTAEQTLTKTISADKIVLDWIISKEFTSVSGNLFIELRGINADGTQIIKYQADPIYINSMVGLSESVTVGLLEDLLNKVELKVAEVQETVVNIPYPGDNGKWMLWNKDTKKYEESGKNSIGLQGPIGPIGPSGPAGKDGKSFQIKDIYATLAALKAAFPSGNEYAYQVEADKNVYLWSANLNDWISLGQIQGPPGPSGINGTDGRSAYMAAKDGGYTGTEAEFNIILATAQTQITALNTSLGQEITNRQNEDAKKLSLTGGTISGSFQFTASPAYFYYDNAINIAKGGVGTAIEIPSTRIINFPVNATIVSNQIYHTGNITVSTTAPSTTLAEGCQHQVY